MSGEAAPVLLHGMRDAQGHRIDLLLRGDVIAAIGSSLEPGPNVERLDASHLTVLPGLLDLQVNGAGGIDVTAEPERLWEVGALLPAYGVTAWVPTVITSRPQARARALAAFAAGPPPGWRGAHPLGLHFEGPFLAPERKGAHPAHWLRLPEDAEPGEIDGWTRENGVLMVTLAPELPGALPLTETLTSRGVLVGIGHTTATGSQAGAAVTAGARLLTHLGNAMPPLLARDPGPIGLALGREGLVAGVIADGHHLAADFLGTVWRALGPERFLAVTDATAALGMPDGSARLGDQEVVVHRGTVRLRDGTLAGSAADLPHCLRMLRQVTGASLAEVAATATTTPADLVGDHTRGRLRVGCRADLVLLDDDLRVRATLVGGQPIHPDHVR